MRRFLITYTDCDETRQGFWHGIDAEHAELRFWDSIDAFGGPEGIRILSIYHWPNASNHPHANPLANL